MKRIFLMISVVCLMLSFTVKAHSASIKFAVVAPDGSAWVNVLKELGAELKAKTAGRWDLNIYSGGVAGDEKVIIKKMKIGQIDAAAFTGVGLGEIYPPVRVLELPFLFKNTAEVDAAVAKILPDLKKGYADKGYEFLGWAEGGFVYIFSNKPIKSIADMKGVKMWLWEGDPLAEKMYQTLGVVPVPLALPDVLMALQTKMIDGVYAPPLGAIAMQWFSKTKYMSDAKLVNSIGAILMTKSAMAKMSPEDQQVLRDLSDKYCKKLVGIVRRDNEKGLETLKTNGIQIVNIDAGNLKELTEKSRPVWDGLVGKLYSKELLDKVTAK